MQAAPFDPAARERCIQAAVAEVQQQHAAWTASQLAWEIRLQLPAGMPGLGDAEVQALVDDMVRDAVWGTVDGTDVVPLSPAPELVMVPGEVRRSDRAPVRDKPGAAKYATARQLSQEEWVIAAAGREAMVTMTDGQATAALKDSGLTAEQAQVAHGLLTSRRAVQQFTAAAGGGKTRVVGAMAKAWKEHTGGRTIGLTTSTNAARVMNVHSVGESHNIAHFLGKGMERGNLPLYNGDRVVIDEASMVSTADMAAIMRAAQAAGARVDMLGDPAQLQSPEAGGAFRLLAAEHGCWKLAEVLRFRAGWEREASVRLHDRDPGVFADCPGLVQVVMPRPPHISRPGAVDARPGLLGLDGVLLL